LAWRIELTGEARKQLQKLGHTEAKALKGRLAELWRYRVGNYRLVCELRDEVLVILVIRIGHRSDVYR